MLMFDGSLSADLMGKGGREEGVGVVRGFGQPELMMYVFDSHIRG